MTPRFGDTDLPPEQEEALRKAKRLEVASIVFAAFAVTVVFLTMGSSQAMKAAWVEDFLAFLPPIAFLVAVRRARRRPDHDHPYGQHRAIGAAHLAAAVALFAMGSFFVIDSAVTLVRREHPTIGTLHLFGHTIWQGWVMVAALVVTGIPNVILGHLKLGLSETLHDKVLFADADMNKADWKTAGGAILGIIGIGLGLWWADAAVAIGIGASIVRDGLVNIGAAVGDLLDRQARTHDDKAEHPLVQALEHYFRQWAWVVDTQVRVRDQGHVFHAEVFVVPAAGTTLDDLEVARRGACDLDWKFRDLVVVPVRRLPRSAGDGVTA